MVFFPYQDLTSSKSPIAIIFVSPQQIVLRPRLKKLFGNFFFTRINGKRYLFNANYPVKWAEGIGLTREFHFFSIANGNGFTPELLQRIKDYKIQNKVSHLSEHLAAVSSDMRVSFRNLFKMKSMRGVADAVERMKAAKAALTDEDFEQLSKELGLTAADYVMNDESLDTKEKERIIALMAKEGLTHVITPIDTSVLEDLKKYKSFDPSWIPTLLNATSQTDLEHKKMEARASKGFNKLFLMLMLGGIITVLLVSFLASSDLNISLPSVDGII